MVSKIKALDYILNVLLLLISIVINYYQFGHMFVGKVILVFIFLLLCYIVLEALLIKYTVDDEGLATNYWFKRTSVEWREITAMKKQNGILFNGGTVVETKNKRLYIKESATNYHKLLRLIIEQIPDPSKVRFDGLNDLKDFVTLTNRKVKQD